MQPCITLNRQAAPPKCARTASVGQPPQATALACSQARLLRNSGGKLGFEASAPIRPIRPSLLCVYPHPSPDAAHRGAGGNRMVNIKMPPDQFCVSSSGADPLASHIQHMVFSMLNGAADACGR
jgi:hypothetical protein